MKDQKEVWNSIAEEWEEFKKSPGRGVEKFLETKKGNILDLGSGSGRNLTKLKDAEFYLVDFSEKMLKLAEKKAKKEEIKINTIVSDMTSIPFQNNFFDSAICIAAIHCIRGEENRKKVVQELYRVLKPHSEILIAVWNKDSKRFKNSSKEKYVKWRDKGERYYYLFDEKEIYNLFERTGFKIKKKIESEVNISFIAEKD